MSTWRPRVLRTDKSSARDIQYDPLWLLCLGLLLIATGIGWRDPWPLGQGQLGLGIDPA